MCARACLCVYFCCSHSAMWEEEPQLKKSMSVIGHFFVTVKDLLSRETVCKTVCLCVCVCLSVCMCVCVCVCLCAVKIVNLMGMSSCLMGNTLALFMCGHTLL